MQDYEHSVGVRKIQQMYTAASMTGKLLRIGWRIRASISGRGFFILKHVHTSSQTI
jgi:hypothetical protein